MTLVNMLWTCWQHGSCRQARDMLHVPACLDHVATLCLHALTWSHVWGMFTACQHAPPILGCTSGCGICGGSIFWSMLQQTLHSRLTPSKDLVTNIVGPSIGQVLTRCLFLYSSAPSPSDGNLLTRALSPALPCCLTPSSCHSLRPQAAGYVLYC